MDTGSDCPFCNDRIGATERSQPLPSVTLRRLLRGQEHARSQVSMSTLEAAMTWSAPSPELEALSYSTPTEPGNARAALGGVLGTIERKTVLRN